MNVFYKAKWIWNENYYVNNYVNFYEKINKNDNKRYTIKISADSDYAVYNEDTLVTFGQYSDYEHYKVYDEIDITDCIIDGENNIIIKAYCANNDSSTYKKVCPGIIYEIYEDSCVIAYSSGNTKNAVNICYHNDEIELVSGQLGYTFKYDATKEIIDFSLSQVQEKRSLKFFPRPIKKLTFEPPLEGKVVANGLFFESETSEYIGQRMQNSAMMYKYLEPFNMDNKNSLQCKFKKANSDGVYLVVDYHKTNTGLFYIDIDVNEDCEILVGYGEHLDDLRVRSFVGNRNFCFSYKAKKGNNRFINPFLRLGLRYMQIHVYSHEFKLNYAGIRPTLYPLNIVDFKMDNYLENKIYNTCVRSLIMCMHEHYEDCPAREQALYSMDSRNQMLCGYYAFNEYDFAKASIRLMALSLRDDGLIELCSPGTVTITIPSFTAIFVTQVYEYLLYSSDTLFIKEMLPYIKKIADEFIKRLDKDVNLLKRYHEAKYWNFYEWQEGLEGSIGESFNESDCTFDGILNCFVSMAFKSIASIYKHLGEDDNYNYYYNYHEVLNKNINDNFYSEDNKAYASYMLNSKLAHYCELTQAMMVYCGVAKGDRFDFAMKALKDGELIPVTLSHSIFKYEALLMDHGNKRFVFDHIAKVWGDMLCKNATTFWETSDGADAFGYAGSLCHGWSAIPAYIYHKYM